jgi:hypothetical protein
MIPKDIYQLHIEIEDPPILVQGELTSIKASLEQWYIVDEKMVETGDDADWLGVSDWLERDGFSVYSPESIRLDDIATPVLAKNQ